MEIRKLTLDDHEAAVALSREAFGPPSHGPTPPAPTEPPPGRHTWGAFDGGRLVAKVVALEFASWFGGVELPTTGIAGVAVAADRRGGGLLRRVFEPLLDEAAVRGEVISTLYPTANGIYRSMGYEVISSYDTAAIPTSELAGLRIPDGVRLRAAAPDDVPAIRAVYARWATAQNGPLTRTGLRFGETPEEFLGDYTGVTLAVDASGEIVGFAGWDRSGGYGSDGLLEVWDLIGLTADAHRALWAMCGSFSSVTRRVTVRTSGHDPARLVLPTSTWDVVERHPYMLWVSDVAAAVTALAPEIAAPVSFSVGQVGYRVTDGVCSPVADTPDAPRFSPQGFALLLAGAQDCANLRMTDHLAGPAGRDAALDALFQRRPIHVRDYF